MRCEKKEMVLCYRKGIKNIEVNKEEHNERDY